MLWFVRGDLGEYRRFKRLPDTASRRRRYLLWVGKAWLAFGLPPLIGVALLGRWDALAGLPREFTVLAARLPAVPQSADFLAGAAIGGVGLGAAAALLLRRRGRSMPVLGDVGALLPRERGELPHGALLSVTAGITEELFFRLYVPLLLVLCGMPALAAFAVAAGLFAAMHLYQGAAGVAATGVLGLALSWLFLASGQLWVAMLVHAAVDLNGLVLRPALTGAWRRGVRPDRSPAG